MIKRHLPEIEKTLLYLLLLLLPTQIAYHFWPPWAFVYGLRVDILAPAVYLTDIFIIFLFVKKLIFERKTFFKQINQRRSYLIFGLVFIGLNIVFSVSVMESLYRWIKIAEFVFLGIYFARQDSIKPLQIITPLFYSAVIFSTIGIAQFIKSGTIGGIFYFLGERSFNMGTPGIALVSLNGSEHLRVYSTFSHPNSLAGFLGVVLLIILLSGQLKKSFVNLAGILIILVCFLLTFSVSSYIGIFFVFSYYLFSKNKKLFNRLTKIFFFLSILVSLLLPVLSPELIDKFPLLGKNIGERLDLAYMSGQMITRRFLVGEGLGTFIVNIPFYKGIFSYSWLLQPVHNIYLLIFSEVGIVGLLLFCYLIYKTLLRLMKSSNFDLLLPILFILFTGLFDHYSLTLQQNTLLLSILLGLSYRISEWKKT